MDPFALFGLARRYDIDLNEVEQKYRTLQKTFHPDKFTGADRSLRRESLNTSVGINEAYHILRDDIKRAESLLGLDIEGREKGPVDNQAFLMEMMELREALSEARQGNDQEGVNHLKIAVEKRKNKCLKELSSALAPGAAEKQRGEGQRLIGELRFYKRFLDEVDSLDEI